jgi:hypothetical protein
MTKGLRSAIVFVEGDWCYAKLRFEVLKLEKKSIFMTNLILKGRRPPSSKAASDRQVRQDSYKYCQSCSFARTRKGKQIWKKYWK